MSLIKHLLFVLSFTISTSLMAALHDYYVGVTEIHYNNSAKTLEISVKLFTDDFEKALLERGESESLFLGEKNENPISDEVIAAYFLDNFEIEVNGKTVEWTFLGKEADIEACWSFLEVEGVKKVKSIKVKNKSLMDVLPQQTNLVHVYANGDKQSSLFLKGKTEKTFKF